MRNYIFLLLPIFLIAQPNCNSFLYNGDTLQYKACKLVENIDERHYQFSREFQEKYDEAIEICPYFSYGYKEKSTAYLKSGDFITWKKLIDLAVKYDPVQTLGYRGWCRYQFFRDYEGAITDIEKLDSLVSYDIGYCQNGNYHLNFAKAICYSALGQKEKAIEIMEKQLQAKDYDPLLLDYYQLGVTYFQMKLYEKAMENFEKQSKVNEIAENVYYKSQILKIQNKFEESNKLKKIAIQLYKENKIISDPYTENFNKVYLNTFLKTNFQ